MKKRLSLLLLAIVANMSVIFSQNVQSYQGTQTFNSMIGYIPGTEKYSYYVNDKGEKLKHGTYSFAGSDETRTNNAQLNGKYTLSATFAHGELNGSYVVSTTINGKTWSYARGWQSFSGSSKLSGVFSKGKPNGTFIASYNGNMKYSGSATLKNGKYVGAYKYSGPGHKSFWVMNGQLTADGKLTGNWRVENIVENRHTNYTFLNDVLIGDGSMTPQLQNIAKQYAEGKISKEAVEQKGYIIKTDSLPLDYFIDYLLFLDDDDYGLDKLEGYDFSDFSSKKYTAIEQLNTITEKGLALIKDEIIKTNDYNAVYHETYNCKYGDCQMFCNSGLIYEKTSDAYYMQCDEKFGQLYGCLNGSSRKVYVNKKQYNELIAIKDSVLIASTHDFSEIFNGNGREIDELGRLYAVYRNNTSAILGQLPIENRNYTYNHAKSLYDKSLSKYNFYIKELSSSNSAIRFTKDSAYILDTESYKKCAWKNELKIWERFNNALYSAAEKEDSLTIMQGDLQKKWNAANTSDIQARIIKQYFAQNQNNSKENLQSAYNRIVETRQLVKAAGIIEKEHNYIMANVPDKLLKNYKKEYKSFIKTKDVNSNDQYKAIFAKIAKLQKNMIAYNEQLQKAEELNNVINGKKSIYPDILKPWLAKYKTNTTLTEDVEKSLANVLEIRNIGQKLLTYISARQQCDSLSTQIFDKSGKAYGDIIKAYQTKVKGEKVVPDMTRVETMDTDYALLMNWQKESQEIIKYIDLRQHCDSVTSELLSMCGKQYSDVSKAYQTKMKSMKFVPNMTSAETIDKDFAVLSEFSEFQGQLKQYIQNRQKVDQLNTNITEKVGKAKNVKKLYGVFYKTLPIAWTSDGDNFKTVEETIALLQKVETTLQSNGADAYDAQLKKAKTADDFKKVLNL